ncbi:hypothetical protein OS493_015690 [Desmophyllum pertusum]|uniref:Uncharacterized protein n=1 Tax=Desmophyllum pertusum TaxID=174260 RepID=A0A9W9YP86_9CNID|nr:hypothetical protein OS493_015690 [Desmophyllum pertusum]
MKTEILRQVKQNYGSRQVMATGRHWQATKGEHETVSRQKRSAPDDSQQKSTLTASEVQMLIKQELGLLQTKSVLKITRSAALDQEVTRGDEEDREPEGDPVPQGDPG